MDTVAVIIAVVLILLGCVIIAAPWLK